MDEPMKIVILGKTGAGKSSLANTIFGDTVFQIDHGINSGTKQCKAESKSVNGRSITLIDTPGFFDTDASKQEELKPKIIRCITECAPGPHAFLILLKVAKFTEQEQAVITEIKKYFSEEVFKYATVVFTHGDQLPEGQKIEEFVQENEFARDLVKKCGGRCHVIDNKYWKNNQQDEYRSNQVQVEELFKTIDKMIEANKGSCYTNEMLQAVEKEIQQEEERIKKRILMLRGNISKEEVRERAKERVIKKLLINLAGTATGALLGALFGVVGMVGEMFTGAATGGAAMVTGPAVGAVVGGVTGYLAAQGADTPREAAQKASGALVDKVKFVFKGHKN